MVSVPVTVKVESAEAAADWLAPMRARSYALLQLRPGDSVLEVGCGAGQATLALHQLVGFGGEVRGVDQDGALVAEAERRAAEAGLARQVRHQRADAGALPFEAGYFDGSRSERLFQHLARPELALREMVRVTRPGGWIVVLDVDYGSLSLDTPERTSERRLTRFNAERLHLNGYAGRGLYRLFRRQGLADLTVEIWPLCLTRYADARQLLQLDRLEAHAVGEGLLTAGELQLWRAALERADAEGCFFASLNLGLVAGRLR